MSAGGLVVDLLVLHAAQEPGIILDWRPPVLDLLKPAPEGLPAEARATRSSVVSIILEWKKHGAPRNLHGAGCPTKKGPMVI